MPAGLGVDDWLAPHGSSVTSVASCSIDLGSEGQSRPVAHGPLILWNRRKGRKRSVPAGLGVDVWLALHGPSVISAASCSIELESAGQSRPESLGPLIL